MTEIYYHAGSFKFSKYLDDGTLVPISVLNDGVDSVTFKDGTWTSSFDSSFDFSDKPITPIISLNTEDSDGNDITWNHTLENIVSSKVITKVVGGDGIYTVSPTLDLTDSASIEKSLSENLNPDLKFKFGTNSTFFPVIPFIEEDLYSESIIEVFTKNEAP